MAVGDLPEFTCGAAALELRYTGTAAFPLVRLVNYCCFYATVAVWRCQSRWNALAVLATLVMTIVAGMCFAIYVMNAQH